jgi:hypothetical protein
VGRAWAEFGSEWKGEMMNQRFAVDLDTLEATLDVQEGEHEVRYVIMLKLDRVDCVIVRQVFKAVETGGVLTGYEMIESREERRTLDGLKDDQASFPHHVIWAARGLWGIPLEFGQGRPEEPPAIAAGEEKPEPEPQAPEPARKRSR